MFSINSIKRDQTLKIFTKSTVLEKQVSHHQYFPKLTKLDNPFSSEFVSSILIVGIEAALLLGSEVPYEYCDFCSEVAYVSTPGTFPELTQ